jgi:DNA-binding response OmpR family regulator
MKDNKMPQAEVPGGASLQHEMNLPYRILVADDEPDIRQLSTEVLIHSGYKVDAAADGAAAWEALRTDRYDLMITDNNMPKLTGVELIRKLRSARMALPVIMATGTLPKEAFTRYPWLQPAATLLKPYAVEELLETVRVVLCTPPTMLPCSSSRCQTGGASHQLMVYGCDDSISRSKV